MRRPGRHLSWEWFATPFLFLVLAEVCCAAGAQLATTPRNRVACGGAALLLTLGGLLGALLVVT